MHIKPLLNHNAHFKKLAKRLKHETGKAILDFNMIVAGDKIMVCLSGGADSYTLLDMLRHMQKHAPINFELVAVNLDQKQPNFPEHILPEYLTKEGVNFDIINQDTYSIVKQKIPTGKTTCSLCSRLRRGIIYNYAKQNNVTKIALGHHRDDLLETLFLNMFYGGSLKAMPPKLLSDDGKNIIIRPLAYCQEKDIKAYAKIKNFPIIPCNLCGSQKNLQRQNIKTMLQQWEQEHPNRLDNMFSALKNVSPSHLADTQIYDFKNLSPTNRNQVFGDFLFDDDINSSNL